MAAAAHAAGMKLQKRQYIRDITIIGGTAPNRHIVVIRVTASTCDSQNIVDGFFQQRRIVQRNGRKITWCSRNFQPGAGTNRTGLHSPIHFIIGILNGRDISRPNQILQHHIIGNDIYRLAAFGNKTMNPHRVFVAEALPLQF